MTWDKLRISLAGALVALGVGWCRDAMADGLPKSGLLPIGEVANAAPAKWSGFYIGGNIGYGWLGAEHAETNGGMYGATDANGKGFIGGAVLGYNLQTGPVVFGIEIEGGYMDISGIGRGIPSSTKPYYQTVDVDSGFYGLAAGRLGFAFGRTLVYGKGGYAFLEGDAGQKTAKPGFKTHRSESLQGFVYGAGIEQTLSERVSVRLEWVRFNLNDVTGNQESITDDPIGFKYTNETGAEIDTFKIGINFKLN